jgi:hypothetical protein
MQTGCLHTNLEYSYRVYKQRGFLCDNYMPPVAVCVHISAISLRRALSFLVPSFVINIQQHVHESRVWLFKASSTLLFTSSE